MGVLLRLSTPFGGNEDGTSEDHCQPAGTGCGGREYRGQQEGHRSPGKARRCLVNGEVVSEAELKFALIDS
jgi:hypothetical protein